MLTESPDLYETYKSISRDPTQSIAAASLFADAYLAPHLKSFQRDDMLEVGCGEGSTLAALRARGFRVRGCDASPSQVDSARRNGVEVELCDGRSALDAAAPGSLAAVIALDVLEHLLLDEALDWL